MQHYPAIQVKSDYQQRDYGATYEQTRASVLKSADPPKSPIAVRYPDPAEYASAPLKTANSRTTVETGLETRLDFLPKNVVTTPGSDPLEQFHSDKKHFLLRRIEEIVSLVYERVQIKYENLRRIDYDACQAGTGVARISSWVVGSDPGLEEIRLGLEREILGLEREKRAEEVACWRDTTRLKESLRDVVKELWQLQRRESLLYAEAPTWKYETSAGN